MGVVIGDAAQGLDRFHEMEVQVPGLRIVRKLVAERALARVGHDLL